MCLQNMFVRDGYALSAQRYRQDGIIIRLDHPCDPVLNALGIVRLGGHRRFNRAADVPRVLPGEANRPIEARRGDDQSVRALEKGFFLQDFSQAAGDEGKLICAHSVDSIDEHFQNSTPPVPPEEKIDKAHTCLFGGGFK